MDDLGVPPLMETPWYAFSPEPRKAAAVASRASASAVLVEVQTQAMTLLWCHKTEEDNEMEKNVEILNVDIWESNN